MAKTPVTYQDLTLYRATISTQDLDRFCNLIIEISIQSGVKSGNRIEWFMPHNDEATYEVFLSPDELVVMKLSVSGWYHIVHEEDREFVRLYLLWSKSSK